MWVRALFLILILIVIVISLINIYTNERNETFVDTSKLHFEGSVHLNGGLKLNNIPNKIAKWPLLQSGEGNEMTLIANKLNEGWEIVQMNQTTLSLSVGGYQFGEPTTGWIVHLKRRVKK